jgi:hypothetical protein
MSTPKPRKRARSSGVPAKRGRPPGTSEPFSLTPSASAVWVTPQQLLGKVEKVIAVLMEHELAPPFNQPVDPIALGIPEYPSVIKHPMDLGTIRHKLGARPCGYKYLSQVVADVRLVWNNCYTFNDVHSEISGMAKVLSRVFENMMKEQMDCRIIADTVQTISAENPGILYAEAVEQIMQAAPVAAELEQGEEHAAVGY